MKIKILFFIVCLFSIKLASSRPFMDPEEERQRDIHIAYHQSKNINFIRALISSDNITLDEIYKCLRCWYCTKDAFTFHHILEPLLKAGFDPNKYDNDIPLSISTTYNCSKCVYLLLLYGADVNKCNKEGETFFQYAANKPEVLAAYQRFKEYIESAREVMNKYAIPDELMNVILKY